MFEIMIKNLRDRQSCGKKHDGRNSFGFRCGWNTVVVPPSSLSVSDNSGLVLARHAAVCPIVLPRLAVSPIVLSLHSFLCRHSNIYCTLQTGTIIEHSIRQWIDWEYTETVLGIVDWTWSVGIYIRWNLQSNLISFVSVWGPFRLFRANSSQEAVIIGVK